MKKPLMLRLLLALAFTFWLSACSDDDKAVTPTPTTFVVVHGAWQAPFAWQFVKKQLEDQGQKVVLVELPGHGADQTDPNTLTLNKYRDKVVAAINPLPGNVVLVGHSLAGMVISVVAEQIPNRIDKMVYIGAFLPANGQSLLDLANTDSTSQLSANIIPPIAPPTLGIPTPNLAGLFLQDGSAAVQQLLVTNYRPEPTLPFLDPAVLTAANFGKVNKYYIHTLQDHVVGYNLQRRMVRAAGVSHTYQLNSSHCPFLAIPDQVTSTLMTIAK
ncbi:alpha/beta fold hydrolase [Hymenobacter segetis]|uniref:Alpha/beta fold hydrolase n=1 Tax=Hymenobacter segetis TaxID=2025509 RepID=A0ABU9LYT0_9BACT